MENSSDNRYMNSRQTGTRRPRQTRWRRRRRRQQLLDSSPSMQENNGLAASEAPDGSVTAADGVRLDSLWQGAKADVEHTQCSPEAAKMGLVRVHSTSDDGILPERLNSSASSVCSDEQPTCLLCCEPIQVADGAIWFSRAAVQDLLVLCMLTG